MRILVADDFDDTRQILRLILEAKGHSVFEAANGVEAVAAAARERPDLVLMDLNMPVLDGCAATRKLRTDPATAAMRVVALTAHGCDATWRSRALDCGCDDCVAKPVDFDTLDACLSDAALAKS